VIVNFILLIVLAACSSSNNKLSHILKEKTYKIDFIVVNDIFHTIETKGLDYIDLPDDPSKVNHEFAGWFFDRGSWNKKLSIVTYIYDELFADRKVYAYFVRTYSQSEIYEMVKDSVFKVEILDRIKNVMSQGTGFFIKEDGTMMTNAHVVNGAWYGRIDQDSTIFDIDILNIIEYNEVLDYAILKVDNSLGRKKFKPVTFNSEYSIGDTIYNIGYPDDSYTSKITEGEIISQTAGVPSYIVTDAIIDHGSSGGITVNNKGEVIGMTTIGLGDGLFGSIPYSVFDEATNSSFLFPKTLKEYFHPSIDVFLGSYNFLYCFFVSVIRTSVSFSSSSSGTAYYTISITPKYDLELAEYGYSISVSINIATKYTVDSFYSTYQMTDYSYSFITLYESLGLSTVKYETVFIFSSSDLYSIDSYSWYISSAMGTVEVYI
jgi:hypothetical protein